MQRGSGTVCLAAWYYYSGSLHREVDNIRGYRPRALRHRVYTFQIQSYFRFPTFITAASLMKVIAKIVWFIFPKSLA